MERLWFLTVAFPSVECPCSQLIRLISRRVCCVILRRRAPDGTVLPTNPKDKPDHRSVEYYEVRACIVTHRMGGTLPGGTLDIFRFNNCSLQSTTTTTTTTTMTTTTTTMMMMMMMIIIVILLLLLLLSVCEGSGEARAATANGLRCARCAVDLGRQAAGLQRESEDHHQQVQVKRTMFPMYCSLG